MFLGPPGAGKGTQAERLRDDLGLVHISTGDLLREELAAGTKLGIEAKGFMDAGELVPDAVVIGMIRERLQSGAAAGGVLFDGFPRTDAQARELDSLLADLSLPLDAVLLLEVSRDELVRRLGGRWLCRRCGRSYHEVFSPYAGTPCPKGGQCELYQRDDDRAEAVAKRLDVYERQTAPLVGYYEGHGILRRVDGEGTLDEVYERLEAAIQA